MDVEFSHNDAELSWIEQFAGKGAVPKASYGSKEFEVLFVFAHEHAQSCEAYLFQKIDQGQVLLLVSSPLRRKGYRGALYPITIAIART